MKLMLGLVTATAVVSVVALSVVNVLHITKATISVVSKERVANVKTVNGKVSTEFVMYVYSDQDIYTVTDSLLNWHFSAGMVYARAKEGTVCDVTLSGYRIPMLSMLQNIIAIECGE